MSFVDTMHKAYLECVYFTETGEEGQPSVEAELTDLFKLQALTACRNFVDAITWSPGVDLNELDPVQVGHDLWYTRNGHGVGFWSRPKTYGTYNATLFSRLALVLGTADAEFEEEFDERRVEEVQYVPAGASKGDVW